MATYSEIQAHLKRYPEKCKYGNALNLVSYFPSYRPYASAQKALINQSLKVHLAFATVLILLAHNHSAAAEVHWHSQQPHQGPSSAGSSP